MATAWAGLVAAGLAPRALWLLPAIGLLALALGRWIHGRLGGLTGDS